MAVVRRGARTYAYRSERVAGRVVVRYVGGEAAARVMDQEATLARAARAERLAERARCEAADRLGRAALSELRGLAALALLVSGCHQHRGAWRRRRDMATSKRAAQGDGADTAAERPRPTRAEMEAGCRPLLDLIDRCRAGDVVAGRELRSLFNQVKSERAFEGWDVMLILTDGDPARRAELELMALLRPDPARQIAMSAELARWRDELAGPAPSALERMLAARVVQCMFAVQVAESLQAARLESMTTHQLAAYLKWVDSAARRLNAALRTLAVVRRLALPLPMPMVVQVTQAVTVEAPEPAPSANVEPAAEPLADLLAARGRGDRGRN